MISELDLKDWGSGAPEIPLSDAGLSSGSPHEVASLLQVPLLSVAPFGVALEVFVHRARPGALAMGAAHG